MTTESRHWASMSTLKILPLVPALQQLKLVHGSGKIAKQCTLFESHVFSLTGDLSAEQMIKAFIEEMSKVNLRYGQVKSADLFMVTIADSGERRPASINF